MAVRTDLTIDWMSSPRVVTVLSPSTEITIQDLVDTLRTAEAELGNMQWAKIIDAAGKDALGGGQYVGITATLLNAVLAFEARPGPSWVLCSISGGNLVAVDSLGANIDPRLPTAFVTVDRTASSSATLQEQADIQYSSFGGGVTVDLVNGLAGTIFPAGTPRQPSNNLVDALAIAQARGLTTLYVRGSITIDSGLDYTRLAFVGESIAHCMITIDPAANVVGCEFRSASIDGTLDGGCSITECQIGTLNYVDGVVLRSLLADNSVITLSGAGQASFLSCYCNAASETNAPYIDCGGTGSSLVVRNYSGALGIKNKTGLESAAISLSNGHIYLDSTVTAGEIEVSGTGFLTDNSTATVESYELINPSSVADAVKPTIIPLYSLL